MALAQISTCNSLFTSKPVRFGTCVVAIVLLAGCSESNRCLGRSVPQFDTDVLTNPILNEVYTQVIRASVKNSVEDDLFGYSFSLAGDLPPGISSRQADRRYIFEGTATMLGEYPVELTVRLSNSPNLLDTDVADLCRASETVAYNLEVTL